MKDENKESLEADVKRHSQLYYDAEPEISDREFDILFDKLKAAHPSSPVLTLVGATPDDNGWKKAKHEIPMGSLNKVACLEDMVDWIDKTTKNDLFVIEKIDGLSIECLYDNGKFTGAVSRGDGNVGDEIGSNVIKMAGVKETLPLLFSGSLRGEIILTKENHNRYFADKANVRNTAAGVARRLDGDGSDKLGVIFYQAIGNVDLSSEKEQMEYLSVNLQLTVPGWQICKDASAVQGMYLEYERSVRDSLDYEIDGLVIKVNDLQEQDELGITDNRPKGAIAYKFPHSNKQTILRDVVWQTGNSGRITPVAVFDAIILAGAEVDKASLHNIKRVSDLGISLGDVILVSRRNDVIPFVECRVSTGEYSEKIVIPSSCPACGGETEMRGEYLVCTSTSSCPAQVVGRLTNWIAAIGVLEWGDKLLTKLVEGGKVKDISDLYRLSIDDLEGIERMGETSAKKCYDLLWKNKEIPLEIFLGGLSIPMAAGSTIKLLMESGYDTLDKIMKMKEYELMNVKGIGESKTKSIILGLRANEQIVTNIIKMGVNVKEKISGGLSGKKIAITGATNLKRSVLQGIIADSGGEYKSSVSKGTTHLVIADTNSTSLKAEGARKLGIELITEDQLIAMTGKQ